MEHLLKIEPTYYDKVLSGEKSFEIRKNDRNYQVGDILHLAEYTGGSYTGRTYSVEVVYLTDYAQCSTYVVMGIKPTTQLVANLPQQEPTSQQGLPSTPLFLELTGDTGPRISIRVASIHSVHSHVVNEGCTVVAGGTPYAVKESYKEVISLLNGSTRQRN